MIVRIYTTDGKRQLPRKQNFRLDDLPPRTPNPADADEIFQRVNSTAMGRKNFAGVIDVQRNADINGVCVESYLARMINQRVLAEHIVAVNPCAKNHRMLSSIRG